MTNKQPSYKTRPIRQFIIKYFDDTGLEEFCEEHFYKVFNRFARGLRKNEKINLLLDHCRRKPNGFDKLFSALHEHYEDNDAMLSELAGLYAQSTQSQSTYTRSFNPPKAAAAKPVAQQPTQNVPATSSDPASITNNVSSDNTPSTPTIKKQLLSAFRDPMWQTAGAIFTIIGVLYTLGYIPISLPDFSTPTNTPTIVVPVSTSTLTPTVIPTQTPTNTPVPPTETASETDTP